MKIGMLWLDDYKGRSLEEKVERAAAYYGDKYGRKPELCFVNPEMLSAEKTINSIVVQTAASIQPNYFWLGNPA